MSNYLIVGASGGIGSQLTDYLQDKGHTVLLAQHNNPINQNTLVQSLTHISSVEATDFDSVSDFFNIMDHGSKKRCLFSCQYFLTT